MALAPAPLGARKGAAPPPPEPPADYYLSFDCATKTFAFGLVAVHAGRYRARRTYLRQRQRELARWAAQRPSDPAELALLRAAAEELAGETRGYLELLDGETKDLVPGVPDKEIHTVPRVKAVAAYVRGRVAGAVARHVRGGAPLDVLIEFQEGPNARSRAVVPALITLFADGKVYLVGPTLKNRMAVTAANRYCFFAEKYAKSYDANKAHAKANFAALEQLFGSRIPAMPAAQRGHVADAVMQILGHLAFGDRATPEQHF